jgi:hypothetical protein
MDLNDLEKQATDLTVTLDDIQIIDLGMEIINNNILELMQGAGIEEDVIDNSYTETEPQSLIDIVSKSSISDENKGLFFTWYIGTVTTILSKTNSPQAPKAPEYPKPFLTRPAPHAPRGLRAISAKRGKYKNNNGYNGNNETNGNTRRKRKRKSRKARK